MVPNGRYLQNVFDIVFCCCWVFRVVVAVVVVVVLFFLFFGGGVKPSKILLRIDQGD